MGEIKKPISKKILEIFIEEDIPQLKSDIWKFIVKPNIKSLAYQICLGVVNQAFKPKGTPASSATTTKTKAYDQAYSPVPNDFRFSTTGKKNIAQVKDWNHVVVSTPEEADKVVNGLRAYLNAYKKVSIAELFSQAEIECDDPVAHKWGWTDLAGISWTGQLTGGYLIVMPSEPIPLNGVKS